VLHQIGGEPDLGERLLVILNLTEAQFGTLRATLLYPMGREARRMRGCSGSRLFARVRDSDETL
jgi:hypothetical protein